MSKKVVPFGIDPKIAKDEYKPGVLVVRGDWQVMKIFQEYGYRPYTSFNTTTKQRDIDIVCFTGGQDLHPRLYGESKSSKVHVGSGSMERDDEEVDYYHFYEDLPKVGICRGMQLLNVMNGGSLIQHVSNHHGQHPMLDIWGGKVKTSSVHHQMCRVPKEGTILGWAQNLAFNPGDKTPEPEMLWFPETRCFGVQGHPEYGPPEFKEYFFKVLKFLVLPTLIPRNVDGKVLN